MTKLYKILSVGTLIGVFSITGSANFFNSWRRPEAKLPSRHQLCTSLKHQIIFRKNDFGFNHMGPNILRAAPTEQARLMKEYQRYNCDGLES